MRPALRAVVLALIACGLLTPLSGEAGEGAPERFLVLVGGRLIDGTGCDPVDDSVVVIQGNRIVHSGPRDRIEIPRRSRVVDVRGLTVLPSLINAHVHEGTSAYNLQRWAWDGVTTVRDLGVSETALVRFREQVPLTPERARLVAAGPLITVPGGYPIVPFGGGAATVVGSPEGARVLAERLLDGPADLLKLALETGAVFGRRIPVLSSEEAQTLVRVAHGRGTKASAHITSVVDIELALEAGVDDLAHMAVDRLVPEDLLQRIVAQGVVWVPTLELWECTGQESLAIANLRRFVTAGGVVALGTDFAGYSCSWDLGIPWTELGLMERAGMTNMEIIVAATSHAAGVCNLEREVGTLEPGAVADLLVVEGDPLLDLEALDNVQLVVHEGAVIRSEIPVPEAADHRRGPRRLGSPQQ